MKKLLVFLLAALLALGLFSAAMADSTGTEAPDDGGSGSIDPGAPSTLCQHDGSTYTQIVYNGTPICTATRAEVTFCDMCGTVISSTPLAPLGHDLDMSTAQVLTPATCVSSGTVLVFCNRCNEYVTIRDSSLTPGHRFGPGTVLRPASCTESGLIKYVCQDCGEIKVEEIAATHNWDEGTVITQATCTEPGAIKYVCLTCGEIKVEQTDPAHNWSEGVVVSPATCVTSGVVKYVCMTCGEVKTEEIPATGAHTFNMQLSSTYVVRRADCTTDGTYEARCLQCGQSFTYNASIPGTEALRIPARGHSFGEPEVLTAPTCLVDGMGRYTCQNTEETLLYQPCAYVTEQILNHDTMEYNELVQDTISIYHVLTEDVEIPATYTSVGIHSFHCDVCGYRSRELTYRLPVPEGVVVLNVAEKMLAGEEIQATIIAPGATGIRLYDGETLLNEWFGETTVTCMVTAESIGALDLWAAACYEEEPTDDADWSTVSEHAAVAVLGVPVIDAPAMVRPGESFQLTIDPAGSMGWQITVFGPEDTLLDEYHSDADVKTYVIDTAGMSAGDVIDIEVATDEYLYPRRLVYIGEPTEPFEGPVLTLPEAMTLVDTEAFMNTAVQTAVIGSHCGVIGERAFADCPNLQYVVVPDNVLAFCDGCFRDSPVTLICAEGSPADEYAKAEGLPVIRP